MNNSEIKILSLIGFIEGRAKPVSWRNDFKQISIAKIEAFGHSRRQLSNIRKRFNLLSDDRRWFPGVYSNAYKIDYEDNLFLDFLKQNKSAIVAYVESGLGKSSFRGLEQIEASKLFDQAILKPRKFLPVMCMIINVFHQSGSDSVREFTPLSGLKDYEIAKISKKSKVASIDLNSAVMSFMVQMAEQDCDNNRFQNELERLKKLIKSNSFYEKIGDGSRVKGKTLATKGWAFAKNQYSSFLTRKLKKMGFFCFGCWIENRNLEVGGSQFAKQVFQMERNLIRGYLNHLNEVDKHDGFMIFADTEGELSNKLEEINKIMLQAAPKWFGYSVKEF